MGKRRGSMNRLIFTSLLGLGLGVSTLEAAPAGDGELRSGPMPVSLPVEQYELKNGLTVMLSPDPRVPIVATELVYLVGSSHEPAGMTGFAHLFEHLMFQGSRHHDAEYFAPFEPIGAEVNGTTSQDRTNYYEHVPKQFAELSLWMESDRMRSLLDVLTQEKLDNQRDVVKNERRQRYEVTPYGMDYLYLNQGLFPAGHPYQHSPIGSHDDLTRASLDDVKAFFRRYYCAKNAGLVVTGDFEVAAMKALIEHYFGDIESGERAATPAPAPVTLPAPVHLLAEDDVELPRLYLAYHSPALFSPGDAELDLLSLILSEGKSSHLFRDLVYDQKLAKDVSAYQMSHKISSVYLITITAAPGVALDELATKAQESIERAKKTPPSEAELARAKSQYKKDFYHRLESVGERASLIGSYFLQTGRGDTLLTDYRRYQEATAKGVHDAFLQYLRPDQQVRLDLLKGKKRTPLRHADAKVQSAPKAKP